MDDRFVDTNVISYLLKRDTRANLYRPHLDGKSLHLSYITIAELYRWVIAYNWGSIRIIDLQAKLQIYSIAQFDDVTAWEWARVMSIKGHPISPGDAWIAAAALRHGFPLVTHNRKHFEHVPGLTLISEA
jgi:tRNA(fMet)-specific endonuclease VapC